MYDYLNSSREWFGLKNIWFEKYLFKKNSFLLCYIVIWQKGDFTFDWGSILRK